MKVIVIGDLHDSPHIKDKSRFRWIGKHIAKTKKPVIVSTGMASLQEIEACVKIINKYHKKIILLHCVSGYPTPEVQTNLKRLNVIKKWYDFIHNDKPK